MKYIVSIAFFLIALQVTAQENYRVAKVRFQGNAAVKSSQLLSKMSLQPKSGLKRLSDPKGVSFSNELLKNDIQEIAYYYQQLGFIHVKVEVEDLHVNDRKETVKINIAIDEGQPVLVSDIFIHRPDSSHQEHVDAIVKKARDKFMTRPHARFNEINFLADVMQLESHLTNDGFAFSEVNYRLEVDAEKSSVDIHIDIDTGPLAYFGDVTIQGNEHVPDNIIKKQLSFEKGDVFSRREIDKSQEQIYALSVFHIVSLNARIEKQKEAAIPVGIRLREAPRFTHKYGIGWGREDKFRALVDVQWLRFLGGARRLHLYLKHSALEPYHINLRFTQPAFLHPNASLGLNPFFLLQHEPGFKVSRLGSNIFMQRNFAKGLSVGATYTYETVNLDTTSIAVSSRLVALDELYNKSSVTMAVTQNNTDDIFYPSRGFKTGLTVKYSGVGPSTYNYLKGIIDIRHYMNVPKAILATYLKGGYIHSYDARGFIPVEDRFFAGGANSVRGWARHELGPQDLNDRPLGGSSLLEGSVELRIPVIGSLHMATFWDFGNVWEEQFEQLPGSIAHSLGIGLRYRTPIGPIRIDIATPIYNKDNWFRWHLSIGEAF